ncbi:hypothetical protein BKA60DRAFT_95319 [Fusarium oxysporum]|nr:hypothetical protein BKA60DRAFT_95319 [Fusarium oxysporum]
MYLGPSPSGYWPRAIPGSLSRPRARCHVHVRRRRGLRDPPFICASFLSMLTPILIPHIEVNSGPARARLIRNGEWARGQRKVSQAEEKGRRSGLNIESNAISMSWRLHVALCMVQTIFPPSFLGAVTFRAEFSPPNFGECRRSARCVIYSWDLWLRAYNHQCSA